MPWIDKDSTGYLAEVLVRYKIWVTSSLTLFVLGLFDKFVLQGEFLARLLLLAGIFGLFRVLIRHGFEQHKKLSPRLKIAEQCFPQPWKNQNGQGVEWFIQIQNISGTSVDEIMVKLTEISPHTLAGIPLPLHVQNILDNPQTRFALHSGEKRRIGLVRGILKWDQMVVLHTMPHAYANPAIPGSKCRLVVTAYGRNSAPTSAIFEAWVNNNLEIQCIPLGPYATKI